MALETATYIDGLVATNPTSSDAKAQGDDHLRLLKSTIKATFPNVTGAVTATHTQLNSVLTNRTAQASTSGTSIDFTSIPSWVKRITVNLSGVSTNGTSLMLVQLGDSGGIGTSGYSGSSSSGLYTSGFTLFNTNAAARVYYGVVTLLLLDAATNTWAATVMMADGTVGGVVTGAGSKSTSAVLDRVRITTVNGTDTFDAGLINIQYD